jgi:hypothetical protein
MLQSVEEHSQRMVALQAKTLKMRTEKRKLKKKKKVLLQIPGRAQTFETPENAANLHLGAGY